MSAHLIQEPISKETVAAIAGEDFVDMIKGVVDVAQGIMTLGGELHVDGETILMEQAGSLREHTWGINLYPAKPKSEWLEFDSMVNLKPAQGNRSRGVESEAIQNKIFEIVNMLIVD
jgi:hypothetical protein